MVALRVHLDDCGEENGPLNVLPGSHLNGRVAHKDIESMVANGMPVACTCKKGDIVAMKPLTLHSSRPTTAGSHRRVIHIEYASGNLDSGLKWYFGTDNTPVK
jgi:ectoine hydroxylase-related dioxygenase (phytanoyl-CoA dioxygenase family)